MALKRDLYTASPRPGTASFRVTDIGWQGLLNPTPMCKDKEELLLDEYLSPSKLQALTGFYDLHQVKTLEMCVDTRENSLGNFGSYLPKLQHLKLNNSMIASLRDLGTSLSNVKVLWMARCGLVDLDGMSSLSSVKELYLAYNNLSDLSGLSMLDRLEILDLEGNNIDDIMQIQYLGLCSKLSTLTVEGNQICLKPHPDSSTTEDYDYRIEVKKLIPHLKYLDEVPIDHISRSPSNVLNKDWLMVKESLKDINTVADDAQHDSRPVTAAGRSFSSQRPHTTQPMMTFRPPSAQRPLTSWRAGSTRLVSVGSPVLESTNSNEMLAEDEASSLTHGVSRVICGNPIKALCARRQTLGASPVSAPKKLEHSGEPTYITTDTDREDLFAELRAWREKHKERLQSIVKEQEPQVMKIMQSDAEDRDSLSGSTEEEELRLSDDDDDDEDWSGRISSDVFCQSPPSQSPTVPASQALERSPSAALFNSRLPNPPKCPTPPSKRGALNSQQRLKDIRIRRLKVHSQQNNTLCTSDITTELADEAFALMDFISASHGAEPAMRKPVEKRNGLVHSENDITSPTLGPPVVRSAYIRSPVERSSSNIISHQPVIRSSAERISLFKTVRPLTSKGAVQRLPNRPALLIAPSKTTNS